MKEMILYIPPKIHAEIMFHVHKSDIEVSGLGRVQRTSDGNLIVSSLYLLPQENSAVTTDICPEALAKLQYETRNDAGDLNFWWHSHVDMGVNWSGTDTDTFEEFGKHGMLVGTVFNKKGQHRSAIYQGGNEFFPYIWKDDVKTSFMYVPSQEEVEGWDKEHEEKCKKKVYGVGTVGNIKAIGQKLDDMLADMPNPNVNHDAMARSLVDDAEYKTFSGEVIEAVIEECIGHLEGLMPYAMIHTYDQFYWWDIYEHFYGHEPQGEEEVIKLYEECLAQPHLFSMMIQQKEQEKLHEQNSKTIQSSGHTNTSGSTAGNSAKNSRGNKGKSTNRRSTKKGGRSFRGGNK